MSQGPQWRASEIPGICRYSCLEENNALNRHGLYARSPHKTPLLKKKHVKARLKFAARHLDKPVKYWENIVWSDESKFELFGCHNAHHVWRTNGTVHHPNSEVWRWEHHGVGLLFSIWYWQTSHNWRKDEWKNGTETFLIKICCHLPGWWRWNDGGHFSKKVNSQGNSQLVSEKENKAARMAQPITWLESNWKSMERTEDQRS